MAETPQAPEPQVPQAPEPPRAPLSPQELRREERARRHAERARWREERRRRYGRGILGPLLIITVGVLLLLNNIGVLPWSIWVELARFWPVLLILIGVDILIGHRSVVGAAVAVILTILVIGGVVALATLPQTSTAGLTTVTVTEPLGSVNTASVRLAPGVDNLHVTELTSEATAGAAARELVDARIARPSWEDVVPGYVVEGTRARFSLASRTARGRGFFGLPGATGDWRVALSASPLLDLQVSAGVGQSDVDLTGLSVRSLELNSGVGQMTVTLPATGMITGSVEAGVGQLKVIVPRSVGARLRVSAGIGSVHVPPGYTRQGDLWLSPIAAAMSNPSSTGGSAELDIHGGVGSIDIEEKP